MKINFSRFSVLLMYVMVIGLPIYSTIIGSYPSDIFIICWYVFWCVQAIATMTLTINKRKQNLAEKAVEETLPEIHKYINENNVSQVIERIFGFKPKVTK